MEAADAWGLADKLAEAIGRSTVLARGPQGAGRDPGLRPARGVVAGVRVLQRGARAPDHGRDLDGKRIAVQLHGEPLPDMVQTLRLAGAEVIEVPVYRWVPPEDTAPLQRLIQAVERGRVDGVAFTSAPAAASFLPSPTSRAAAPRCAPRCAGRSWRRASGRSPPGRSCARASRWSSPPAARLGALVREIVEQLPGAAAAAAGGRAPARRPRPGRVVDGRLIPLAARASPCCRS